MPWNCCSPRQLSAQLPLRDSPPKTHRSHRALQPKSLIVRYRGGVGIAQASSVEVVQFKYSIAQAAAPMRATDLRKTLAKFAQTDADFTAAVGGDRVRRGINNRDIPRKAVEVDA